MNMATTASTDRFSWRRVYDYSKLYWPILRWQILFLLIFTVLNNAALSFAGEVFASLVSIVCGIAIIALPFTLGIGDKTVMRLAPVKASERLAFYLTLIFGLYIVCETLWSSLVLIVLSALSDTPTRFEQIMVSLPLSGFRYVLVQAVSTLSTGVLYLLIVYTVVTKKSHPILHGILRVLACYGVFIILAIVAGVAVAFMSMDDGSFDDSKMVATMMDIIVKSSPVLILALLGVYAWLIRRFYRKLQ